MTIKQHIKRWFIQRSLNKRKLSKPFLEKEAEHYSIPKDADEYQINSYYFSCHDMKGNSLLLRYAERGNKDTEVWFAYKDEKGNAYVNEKQLYKNEKTPVSVECKKTAKKWYFGYDGEITDQKTKKKVKAKFEGEFTATDKIFDFGYHLDSYVLAKAIAKEKWTKEFFKTLDENTQIHYEQPGSVEGVLVLDGKKTKLSLPAMRDHSFGKRDWNYMNNHFWLMALMENGDNLNANRVSYPAVRELQTGYFVEDEKTICVSEAEIVGEISPNTAPDSFTYRAKLTDGRELDVKCMKELEFVFPFYDGEYVIYEGIGTFEFDGKRGRGVLEFGWNGDSSRHL